MVPPPYDECGLAARARNYGCDLARSLKERNTPVMDGTPTSLVDHASQSRADNRTGLKLQHRRQHADDRDAELRARQIDRVGCNATPF